MLEGKFMCVRSINNSVFKEGEVYTFVEGRTTREDGTQSRVYYSFYDFENQNCGNCKLEPVHPKQLLKSGDKVTYRDGTERFVLLETETLHDDKGYPLNSLKCFKDDLTELDFNSNDIMKIERGTELIWERPAEVKTIKMTLTEVATKLGLDENTKLEIEM